MEIIPFFDPRASELKDGDLVSSLKWCKHHYNEKCSNFYNSIVEEGFYICPYGFTSYAKRVGQLFVIYSSVLVEDRYDKKKALPKIKNEFYILKFSTQQFLEVVNRSIEYNDLFFKHKESLEIINNRYSTLQKEFTEYKELIFDTLHEIRSLNNVLSSQSDDILSISRKYLENSDDFFKNGVHSILATSGLIASRLASLDLLVNSSVIEQSIPKDASIYGKFYKCKQILSTVSFPNKVTIGLNGESFSDARINDLFEICPFLIFENYLKYSPSGTCINVNFYEDEHDIHITISNEGPMNTTEELSQVFKLHYRSNRAKGFKGNGIGLYIVKLIFNYLNFDIEVDSSQVISRRIDGIKYSQFTTRIKIPISVKRNMR